MRLLSVFLILSLAGHCSRVKNNKLIEEDLSFKMIDFFNVSDIPDSTASALKEYVKTVNPDTLTGEELRIFRLLNAALEQGLINKPSVRVTNEAGEFHRMFLNEDQEKRFKGYSCHELHSEGKKVRVKAEVEVQTIEGMEFYIAKEIQSVEKVDGETVCRK